MVLSTDAAWCPFRDGSTIGSEGSEGGVTIHDEEHPDGARITLERTEKRRLFRSPVVGYAITCGLYGWMVHTRFFDSEENARAAYNDMRDALERLIDALPLESDPEVDQKLPEAEDAISAFIKAFP
jgi:hypothetical protein